MIIKCLTGEFYKQTFSGKYFMNQIITWGMKLTNELACCPYIDKPRSMSYIGKTLDISWLPKC